MMIEITYHAYKISSLCAGIKPKIYVHKDNPKIFLIKLIKNP